MSITKPRQGPTATPISGKRFRRNHLSLEQRAKMGAAIYDRKDPVAGFTLHQVEGLVGAPVSAINKHRTRQQRQPTFTLAKRLAKASDGEIANAKQVLGEDWIFSRFFEPRLPL